MYVYLNGKRHRLSPAMAIGKGGEADVFGLPDGRAVKVFKEPDHPDLAAFPADRAAAAARIALHQRKLPAFPGDVPARVVAPETLATKQGGAPIVGYAMRRVDGATPLYRYAEPRFGRTVRGSDAVAILRDLYLTLNALHAAGIVIGDFNDLDVLVSGARAFLIDADSFQYGRFRCEMFTERFVDPLLCDPNASSPQLVRPHGEGSDGYAFTVMLMRTLLFVGPYGGVHRPKEGRGRVPAARRPLARLTVFEPDVVYPKPARHWGLLPDDLLHYFHEVFERDRRGPMPAELLDALRWTRCSVCHTEHARAVCPGCAAGRREVVAALVRVRGKVRAHTVTDRADAIRRAVTRPHETGSHRFWIHGDALLRTDRFGPLRVGDVIGAQTRFWVGESLGFGFYAAGRLTVGFVFDPERAGLNDQIALPPLRGSLMSAHCALSGDRAWLITVEQIGAKVIARCTLISRTGAILATTEAEVGDEPWLSAGAASCAIGPYLFVATDDGIVRAEANGGAIQITRTFPDTEPFVDASSRLHADERGLFVVSDEAVVRLEMS